MERIEAEASRMGVLVEDLLLLARMDQGLPIARDRVDLAALSGRAVEDARAAWPDHPIRLDATGQVEVVGDEGRLRQVLDNLLGNVGVHTPPGTTTTVRVATDATATLEISDDGPGIEPGEADRVFERFYRADPPGPGSGEVPASAWPSPPRSPGPTEARSPSSPRRGGRRSGSA